MLVYTHTHVRANVVSEPLHVSQSLKSMTATLKNKICGVISIKLNRVRLIEQQIFNIKHTFLTAINVNVPIPLIRLPQYCRMSLSRLACDMTQDFGANRNFTNSTGHFLKHTVFSMNCFGPKVPTAVTNPCGDRQWRNRFLLVFLFFFFVELWNKSSKELRLKETVFSSLTQVALKIPCCPFLGFGLDDFVKVGMT